MKNKVFIITGQQGSGKTIFLGELVQELRHKGIQVGGLLSEGFWDQKIRSKFELVDITTSQRMLFCTRTEQPGWENSGHFYINPEAITFGERVLHPSVLLNSQIIAIDEIGPFELRGSGWCKAIEKLIIELPEIPFILVVRENLLKQVTDQFNIKLYDLFQVQKQPLKTAVEEIVSFCAGNQI
jgi:nucleoside-triphosphatase THEP1